MHSIKFSVHICAFRLLLKKGSKALQNRSENFKSGFLTAECIVSGGVYNSFRKMHTKPMVKLETFGSEGAEGRSSREKPRSRGHLCAAPEGERTTERQMF